MSSLSFSVEAEVAMSRGSCYGLLASVYNLLPSSTFVARILSTDIRTMFRAVANGTSASETQLDDLEQGLRALDDFREQARNLEQKELAIRMGVDRTRLFRGIKRGYGPPPPYESLYRGSECVMAESAVQVKKVYFDIGYHLPQHCKELPDYIGIELDFMSHVCREEAQAWTTANKNRAVALLDTASKFVGEHLIMWVPGFCDEALNYAREGFYQGIAKITRAFVIIDYQRLRAP
jgi:anaerobic sulfite reductase subunit A